MDDYLEFIDDLRHMSLDNAFNGPVVDDMAIFLAHSPELIGGNILGTCLNYVVSVMIMFFD